jgi:hypothetical protein
MSIPTCPKCRKKPIAYKEFWINGMEYDSNNGVPSEVGYLFSGYPIYVQATCECGHIWRLKKVIQITDIKEKL